MTKCKNLLNEINQSMKLMGHKNLYHAYKMKSNVLTEAIKPINNFDPIAWLLG